MNNASILFRYKDNDMSMTTPKMHAPFMLRKTSLLENHYI